MAMPPEEEPKVAVLVAKGCCILFLAFIAANVILLLRTPLGH